MKKKNKDVEELALAVGVMLACVAALWVAVAFC